LIRIGDFARLGQVSVVTLRHYDEIGLLKPGRTDEATGYRYYSVAQLDDLNHILALKDVGFSLDQIETVLQGLSSDQLGDMLRAKHLEAQRALVDEQARLTRIRERLHSIEGEDAMPDYEVTLRTVAPLLVASRTVTIPTNREVPAYLDEAYGEVYRHISVQGAKDAGPCLAIWHQPAATLANEVVEAVVPVDRAVASSAAVKVYELPQAQVASAAHRGAFESLTRLHATLLSWIESNSYQVVGPYREVYTGEDSGLSSVEVQYPVVKAQQHDDGPLISRDDRTTSREA
jgi:DNA-binding transcriptional MerR regulator